jgi:cell division protein FtsB
MERGQRQARAFGLAPTSDPDAIEHEAREKLHYARPGEVIYTLPEPPPQAAQPANGGK